MTALREIFAGLSGSKPAQVPDYTWFGASGAGYAVYRHPMNADFINEPAVYLWIARGAFPNGYVLNVGETDDLGRRMNEHRASSPKWRDARSMGLFAIDILWMPRTTSQERRDVESDLVSALYPILTERPVPAGRSMAQRTVSSNGLKRVDSSLLKR